MSNMYPVFPERIPDASLLISGPYMAGFAMNRQELEEVQRLRFEVFNLEMGEGLQESFLTRMDIDPYDDHCHHLIVRDRNTGALVGTYRMQDAEMARSGNGFYSDNEYCLDQFPEGMLDQALELGRACISKEHRNGRVLFLLWRGLLFYLQCNKLRYMFGCCSLTSQDTTEGLALFARLHRAGNLHSDFRITAREPFAFEAVEPAEEEIADTQMPRLMRLYLDYGACICSEPAIDREFKTIDYLALFDFEHMSPKLMKVFKKDFA